MFMETDRISFIGKDQNSIDAKNRMIIPAKHRSKLGNYCVLTKGLDTCLYIYPIGAWLNLTDKLKELPLTDPDARAFVRHFTSNAVECEMDKQGRITLPQELREHANIEKDLVTVGAVEKIEVWSRELWESSDSITQLNQDDFNEKMKHYGVRI